MDRWVIIVVRSNGKDVEILPHLYDSEQAACGDAEWQLTRWLGVTLEVVKIFVPLQGVQVCGITP